MNAVMGLIEDLLSPEIRPNSPEIRPPETRADSTSSPLSPLSPGVGDNLKPIEDSAPDVPCDPAIEARRQRVLAMLAERPGIRYAVLTDTEADPEAVLLTLAIRGRATCELRIPREKYDGVLLLDLIERHGGTIH